MGRRPFHVVTTPSYSHAVLRVGLLPAGRDLGLPLPLVQRVPFALHCLRQKPSLSQPHYSTTQSLRKTICSSVSYLEQVTYVGSSERRRGLQVGCFDHKGLHQPQTV